MDIHVRGNIEKSWGLFGEILQMYYKINYIKSTEEVSWINHEKPSQIHMEKQNYCMH